MLELKRVKVIDWWYDAHFYRKVKPFAFRFSKYLRDLVFATLPQSYFLDRRVDFRRPSYGIRRLKSPSKDLAIAG